MKKKLYLLFLVCTIQISFGQDTLRNFRPTAYTHSETKKSSFRLGFGTQRNFYSEIGFSRHLTINSCTGFFSKGYYTSIEWLLKSKNYNDVYALKVGYELSTMLGAIGLETKYQTNFNTHDFVITPKIGYGLGSEIFLFYGFNISTWGNPFPNAGKHQFSIVFHLNKRFMNNN
jgi:hypothetical protein